MATTKPQFNCYIDPGVKDEIEAYLLKTGATKGKLVENLWRFFNMRDPKLLADKISLLVSDGIPENAVPELYKILVTLQKGLEERMKET